MFDYPILTEEEAMKARYSLLEDGDYPAVIKKVTPRVSGAQNNMFEVDLDIYDKEGIIHPLKDYLVFTPKMIWKVIHCAKACLLTKEYEQKKLYPETFLEKNVIVTVKTQKGKEIPNDKLQGKPPGSMYPDKNVIDDYKVAMSPANNSEFIDDDVDFLK